MADFDAALHPHRRRNPLTGRWVLVSPQRALRPWQGRQEAAPPEDRPHHDAGCYLCPGNRRVGGTVNPGYTGTYVFDNDHAALRPEHLQPSGAEEKDALFAMAPARGRCRVLCFSPDHALSLPELPLPAIEAVVDTWCAQTEELGREHTWVQVFENKGELMGCSQPHPHGQIWATDHLPDEAADEDRAQRAYLAVHGRPLLLDLAQRESALGTRVVVQTEHWLAVVPFWATWPFETLLMPRGPVARLPELDASKRQDLARALKELLTRYDNLFECSFPYSMGWHGAPYDAQDARPWQVHAHLYPPLLRSATVRKFMVGYEMLAEAQRDLTPEQAAERLRATATLHFRERRP